MVYHMKSESGSRDRTGHALSYSLYAFKCLMTSQFSKLRKKKI